VPNPPPNKLNPEWLTIQLQLMTLWRIAGKIIYLAASALEVFPNWALYKLTYSFILELPLC